MGLDFTGNQNFSTSNIASPFVGLQQSLAGFGQQMADRDRLALDAQARKDALVQQDLANKRADASLVLQQNQDKRAQDQVAREESQRKVAQGIAADFRPGTLVVSPILDNAVMNNLESLIPGQVDPSAIGKYPYAPDQDPYYIDPELYSRQAAMQALYDKEKPSQDDAYRALTAKGMASGMDSKEAAQMATALSTGLVSDASRQKQYQDSAEAYNKLALEKFKEDSANNREVYKTDNKKGTTINVNTDDTNTGDKKKGTGTDINGPINNLGISDWNLIDKDREDVIKLVASIKPAYLAQGVTEEQFNKFANAAVLAGTKASKEKGGAGFDEDTFNTFVTTYGKDPHYFGSTTTPPPDKVKTTLVSTELPESATASMFEERAKAVHDADQNRQLSLIFGDKTTNVSNNNLQSAPVVAKNFTEAVTNIEGKGYNTRRDNPNDLTADPGAMGKYQFIASTAKETSDKLGLSWDKTKPWFQQEWTTPDNQEKMFNQLVVDNTKALTTMGIDVTPVSVFGAHNLGATGFKHLVDNINTGTKLSNTDITNIRKNLHTKDRDLPTDKIAQKWMDTYSPKFSGIKLGNEAASIVSAEVPKPSNTVKKPTELFSAVPASPGKAPVYTDYVNASNNDIVGYQTAAKKFGEDTKAYNDYTNKITTEQQKMADAVNSVNNVKLNKLQDTITTTMKSATGSDGVQQRLGDLIGIGSNRTSQVSGKAQLQLDKAFENAGVVSNVAKLPDEEKETAVKNNLINLQKFVRSHNSFDNRQAVKNMVDIQMRLLPSDNIHRKEYEASQSTKEAYGAGAMLGTGLLTAAAVPGVIGLFSSSAGTLAAGGKAVEKGLKYLSKEEAAAKKLAFDRAVTASKTSNGEVVTPFVETVMKSKPVKNTVRTTDEAVRQAELLKFKERTSNFDVPAPLNPIDRYRAINTAKGTTRTIPTPLTVEERVKAAAEASKAAKLKNEGLYDLKP